MYGYSEFFDAPVAFIFTINQGLTQGKSLPHSICARMTISFNQALGSTLGEYFIDLFWIESNFSIIKLLPAKHHHCRKDPWFGNHFAGP